MVANLINDGYTIIRRALTPDLCDRINKDFQNYVETNREQANKYKLDTGNHQRLCNMHVISEAAREAIFSNKIMTVLDKYFEEETFVATSLYFEQSSTQTVHRDVPFFNTKPRNIFVGVWLALEDVDPKSGPLTYYPKSHLLDIEIKPVSETGGVSESFAKYCLDIQTACVSSGLKLEKGIVAKGDCIIWHSELAHGGSPIEEPGTTRKSMVFHCAPKDVVMYGPEEYFKARDYELKNNHMVIDSNSGRNYIGHPSPEFAFNN